MIVLNYNGEWIEGFCGKIFFFFLGYEYCYERSNLDNFLSKLGFYVFFF